MKRFLYLVIGLVVSVGLMAQETSLKGKVMDKLSEEGIPFATVVVLKGEIQLGGVACNAEGEYVINHIPAGKFTVECRAVGYQKASIDGVVFKEDAIRILNIDLRTKELRDNSEVMVVPYQVTPPKNSRNIVTDKVVLRSGVGPLNLKGKIIDKTSGKPIAKAVLSLFQEDGRIGATNSDKMGRYQFENLEDGKYEVLVRAKGYESVFLKNIKVFKGNMNQLNIQLNQSTSW